MRVSALAATIILCFSSPVQSFADKELAATARVTATHSGRFYFKMVPVGDREAGGNGFLYLVARDEDRLLYTTTGWYANKVYVSSDGRYICRIGNQGRTGDWYFKDRIPDYQSRGDRLIARSPHEHIAVAFYENGKQIKSYAVSYLIPDIEDLTFSKSHYSFMRSTRFHTEPMSDFQKEQLGIGDSHGYWVIFETVDGQTIVFNMRTGMREGGDELVKAFSLGEREALEVAKRHLLEKGVEGGLFARIRVEGDFKYRMIFKKDDDTFEVIVDRRTGLASLE